MKLSIEQARRIALGAQGFGAKTFRSAMKHMNVLQLDSVNVLCRSHYLPMLARIGPYDRNKLDTYLYESGEHYEFVHHEASFAWQDHHRLMRHRTRRKTWDKVDQLEAANPGYLDSVRAEVAERGPLSIKDLSDPGQRTGPWWGRSKGKIALEWLYLTGRLSIRCRTKGFVTVYDLPENVLRAEVLAEGNVSPADAKRQLLLVAASSHGVGTARDLNDYFRLKIGESRTMLEDLAHEGRLKRVKVAGWNEPTYLHPEAKRPRKVTGAALLSPFDPVVWFRPRVERLFDFKYRIEIYVPEPKRVYGYYVLPFLNDGRLVARVDLKADRKAGALRVQGAFLERTVDSTRPDPERTARALNGSLEEMAKWLGLGRVVIGRRGNLVAPLRRSNGASI